MSWIAIGVDTQLYHDPSVREPREAAGIEVASEGLVTICIVRHDAAGPGPLPCRS